MNRAQEVFERLATLLEGISTANGYRTDAGAAVYRRPQDMARPEDMPAMALLVRPESLRAVGRRDARVALTAVISAEWSGSGDTESTLLDMAWDIRAALLHESAFKGLLTSNDPVEIGDVVFQLPDPGQKYARAEQTVSVSFIEKYQV